jgi:acyl carrier protein
MANEGGRVMVAFEGGGTGTGDLTWGQTEYWERIAAQGSWLPLGGVKALRPGTTIGEVAEEVSYLMSRYPAVRTRLRFGPEGRPTQHVAAGGTIAVEVVDAEDADPEKVAEAVAERYRAAQLDFTTEWPLRVAVVRRGGAPTHMIALISHLAIDGTGGEIMLREVTARTADPVPGMQPLAQTAWQQSPAGQRQNAASLHHAEGVLRAVAPDQFAGHGEHRQPRYWEGELDSPAFRAALHTIAEETGAESSTVLLTVFAMAVQGITGVNPVLVRPTIKNRFRPSLTGVVCTLAQAGYCAVDIDTRSFRETLRRTKRSVLGAYKHAYFDPRSMAELRTRIAQERGTPVEVSCFLNDRRATRRGPADEVDRADRADHPFPSRDKAPGSFHWRHSQNSPALEKLLLEVDDAPGSVRLTLTLDTAYLSLAEGEALVCTMEEIAVAQAESVTADPFPAIVEILRAATGETVEWAAGITPESRLEDDIRLESMEVLALGDSLRTAYGVDLPTHLAGLDIDAIIALTVGDLVALCRG